MEDYEKLKKQKDKIEGDVLKMIKIKVNNGREIEVSQSGELIKLTTKEGENIERVDGISEGEFVMLMNYYSYIKDNNIQCDFINYNGNNTLNK